MSSLVGKIVMYNGETEALYGCSSPYLLALGKRYLVISEKVGDFQTNLYLKGVEGEFNSMWFNEVESSFSKKEWLAVATLYNCPDTFVGKRISLQRFHEDTKYLEKVNTSEIIKVENVYGNIYLFETTNSVYITKVNLRTGC